MSRKLDELEKRIHNVMTDDEVEEALRIIQELRHEYEQDRASAVPALEDTDIGMSALAEDALMHGVVDSVTWRNYSDHYEVEMDILIEDNILGSEEEK